MGSIKSVERMNAGKNTKCLPAVPIKAKAQFAIGKSMNSAAIRHKPQSHSPIPEIIPLLFS